MAKVVTDIWKASPSQCMWLKSLKQLFSDYSSVGGHSPTEGICICRFCFDLLLSFSSISTVSYMDDIGHHDDNARMVVTMENTYQMGETAHAPRHHYQLQMQQSHNDDFDSFSRFGVPKI